MENEKDMNVKIQSSGKNGATNTKGTSRNLAEYLEHEDKDRREKGLPVFPFVKADGTPGTNGTNGTNGKTLVNDRQLFTLLSRWERIMGQASAMSVRQQKEEQAAEQKLKLSIEQEQHRSRGMRLRR